LDGSLLAAAVDGDKVRLWDTASGDYLRTFQYQGGEVEGVVPPAAVPAT